MAQECLQSGFLYTECTATPGNSTILSSTVPCLHTDIRLTIRSFLLKTALRHLLRWLSAIWVIPAILGLALSEDLLVACRHRQWTFLHSSDIMVRYFLYLKIGCIIFIVYYIIITCVIIFPYIFDDLWTCIIIL